MTKAADLLAAGWRFHQAGDLVRAEQAYRQSVQQEPGNAQGWYLLGLLYQAQRKHGDAISHFQQALWLRPDFAQAQHDLGVAYMLQRQPDQAEGSFRRAVALNPSFALAQHNLGIALTQQGKPAEALPYFQEAARLQPDSPDFHRGVGSTLRSLGRLDEAVVSYQRALKLRPNFPDAHHGLACVFRDQRRFAEAAACCRQALQLRPNFAEAANTLGAVLAAEGKTEEALSHYQTALRLRPDYPEALTNLGHALFRERKLEEAEQAFRRAIQLDPTYSSAFANLGVACAWLGKLDEALAPCREAVRLRPEDATAHTQLGLVYERRGEFDSALACYERALAINPNHAEAHWGRATVWLMQGELERGWAEYEWHWQCPDTPPRPLPGRPWDGSPLAGRTLLIHTEQGLGDTFQFIRYAPLLRERGARVIVLCQKPLLRLLSGCPGIDQLLTEGDLLPAFDFHVPLMSVPRLYGISLATIPANVPYLTADPGLVEHWRRKLATRPGFKIGINWQGNPQFRLDRQRSFALTEFAPLAALPGIQLVSLQHGPAAEQLRAVAGQWPITDLGGCLDEEAGPFMDRAAVMKNLDLVVTSDTSIAHLAGALGVPVWVALAKVPDWRFLLERQDCPWYPTMRLFRQERAGEWGPVFQHLAEEVVRLMNSQTRQRPVLVEVSLGELLDKIAILQIKRERISDPAKRANVQRELDTLETARAELGPPPAELAKLMSELKRVNEVLWDIEDDIRLCERNQDFGSRFIELARAVYHQNDHRGQLKRQINDLLGSRLREEKAYTTYGK